MHPVLRLAARALVAAALASWTQVAFAQEDPATTTSDDTLEPVAIAQPVPIDQPVPIHQPVLIDIPSIGTHASVVPLGLDDDGAMSAPTNPDTVGWYAFGPGVGAPGNALLDGHVDWGGRLRAFGLLKLLEPGDRIHITDVDGNSLSYSVSWVQLVDADSASLDDIFEQGDQEEITLITCGGYFDHSIHMYVSRWIVRAVRDVI